MKTFFSFPPHLGVQSCPLAVGIAHKEQVLVTVAYFSEWEGNLEGRSLYDVLASALLSVQYQVCVRLG